MNTDWEDARDEPLLLDVPEAVEPDDVPVEEPVDAAVPVVLEPLDRC
jgi:hypothetical protein